MILELLHEHAICCYQAQEIHTCLLNSAIQILWGNFVHRNPGGHTYWSSSWHTLFICAQKELMTTNLLIYTPKAPEYLSL